MQTVKTVLWAAVGIRRQADHERSALNPLRVAAVAVILVVLFILTLVTIVRVVTV